MQHVPSGSRRCGRLLDQRIVVLDGAWGTMFQDTGLSPGRLPRRNGCGTTRRT